MNGEAVRVLEGILTGGGGTADGAILWTDWVDVVAAVAGIAAVIFAIVTVRQAAKGSEENLKALRVERRIDFELDVLSTLAEYNEKDNNTFGVETRITTLARMLPKELIPITRAAANLPSTVKAEAVVAGYEEKAREVHTSVRSYLRETLADEIHVAIETKLRERG